MRSEAVMMDLIHSFSMNDNNILIVSMEGSRSNPTIIKDKYQDYDITMFVSDPSIYIKDKQWLDYFGERVMVQEPDGMDLYEKSEYGYSYLIHFKDGNKMDLTINHIKDLEKYLRSDKLAQIIINKTNNVFLDEPTDVDFHIKKLSEKEFDDTNNEFWFLTPYVIKGLLRHELIFAIDHLYLVREELLRMIALSVGVKYGFDFSIGKNYKFLNKYIDEKLYNEILNTYKVNDTDSILQALLKCMELYDDVSKDVAAKLDYKYPDYSKNMKPYIDSIIKGL